MSRADALGMFWFDLPAVKPPKKEKVKKEPPEPIWLKPDYLPGLEEALNTNYNLLTDAELIELGWGSKKVELIFDIECYTNYFLVAFKEPISKKYLFFEMDTYGELDIVKLEWVIQNFKIIGFNSFRYDIPMVKLACCEKFSNTNTLKEASDMIIQQNLRPADIYREFGIAKHLKQKNYKIDHIDLIEVLPLDASLKVYSGRIHAPKIQDLPFHPSSILSAEQRLITRHYCANDLLDTELLRSEIKNQISLREDLSKRYGIDLRSKSDAQIAEAVIRNRVENRKRYRIQNAKVNIGESFKYRVPNYLKFQTPMMKKVLSVITESDFIVGDNGRVGLPKEISDLKIKIGNTEYQMGIGGLHSKEKSVYYKQENGMIIRDRDVTSYYPKIIINQSLYPENLGRDFLIEFENIVNERISAKRNGNTVIADSLKITINGSFGKFGSQYSILYSPSLVIQVTLTGQLSLLLLIEMLELSGINVVSGNTDGVVIYTNKTNEELLNNIIKYWESITGFETEETRYKALYSRDVNNYIAVKEDNKTKLKGAYRIRDLSKNPVNEICIDAVIGFLTKGQTIEDVVKNCNDITKFISLRAVKGGGYKDGEFLGKTVRWYKSNNCPGPIIYAKSGNDVPVSKDCRPCQRLPDTFPEDVDFEWYINESYRILNDLGLEIKNPHQLAESEKL